MASRELFNNSANVTYKEYTESGKWEVEDSSPEELFNFLAPDLFELIDGVEVGKLTQTIGNNYTKVKLSTKDNFSEMGIYVTRKDYYEYLKTYCLNIRCLGVSKSCKVIFALFSEEEFPNGINKLYLTIKSPLTLTIVAPGNFYDGSRYFNTMDIDKAYEYSYTVR